MPIVNTTPRTSTNKESVVAMLAPGTGASASAGARIPERTTTAAQVEEAAPPAVRREPKVPARFEQRSPPPQPHAYQSEPDDDDADADHAAKRAEHQHQGRTGR